MIKKMRHAQIDFFNLRLQRTFIATPSLVHLNFEFYDQYYYVI